MRIIDSPVDNIVLSWGLGSRDSERDRSVLQGRLDRSVRNHIESMMIFVPLMLVAHIADLSSDLIFWGTVIYSLGRVVFPILYVAGVPVLRSVVWGISVTGLALIGFDVVKAAL